MHPRTVITLGPHRAHPRHTGYRGNAAGFELVRHCTDIAEALAQCESGNAQILIHEDDTRPLNAAILERLATTGAVVLAATDDPLLIERYLHLNVPTMAQDWAFPHLAGALNQPHTASSPATPANPYGSLVAVWGPVGSPGRSTLALNLAAEWAERGSSVLLIDADTYGPSLGTFFKLPDCPMTLAQLCYLSSEGALSDAAIEQAAIAVSTRQAQMRVIAALPTQWWRELRARALRALLLRCRQLYTTVIVDCSFSIERHEDVTPETFAPLRNTATLVALQEADTIVAVGAADLLSVQRLRLGLAGLARLVGLTPFVVLNKIRSTVASPLGRQLQQTLPVAAHVPWDLKAADEALQAARPLLVTNPTSALRRGIEKVSHQIEHTYRHAVTSPSISPQP